LWLGLAYVGLAGGLSNHLLLGLYAMAVGGKRVTRVLLAGEFVARCRPCDCNLGLNGRTDCQRMQDNVLTRRLEMSQVRLFRGLLNNREFCLGSGGHHLFLSIRADFVFQL
jgi:hypothetical protein